MSDETLTSVAHYHIIDTFEAFERAIEALVRRTESEGLQSVVDYQFFGDPVASRAGAAISYADREAWIEHHEILAQWPEFAALRTTIGLEDYLLLGPAGEAITAALAAIPLRRLSDPVAGFTRDRSSGLWGGTRIVTVAEYELVETHEGFGAAIGALAERVEREGIDTLLDYRFYAEPDVPRAGGVMSYADWDAFVEHHQVVAPWPEYATFKESHTLARLGIYGTLGADARAWLGNAKLLDRHVGRHVAGFVRTGVR